MAKRLTDEVNGTAKNGHNAKAFDVQTFRKDVSDLLTAHEKIGEVSKAYGDKLNTLCETRGYCKPALQKALNLKRKGDGSAKVYHEEFQKYYDALELGKDAGEDEPDMIEESGADEASEAHKVAPLQAAVAQAKSESGKGGGGKIRGARRRDVSEFN